MAKVVAKRKSAPKRPDPKQFRRFLEGARKRGMNESLEDFAARFGKSVRPKPKSTLPHE